MGPTGGRNIPYFFAKEGGVNKDQPGKLGALLWAYRGKRNGFCDGSTCLVMRERIYESVLFYEFYIYVHFIICETLKLSLCIGDCLFLILLNAVSGNFWEFCGKDYIVALRNEMIQNFIGYYLLLYGSLLLVQ